jgi:hypothetical protein
MNPFKTARSAMITAAIVVILIVLAIGAWQKYRSQAAQGRLDRGQHEALGNSARDAIATQGDVGARERKSDELTRTNEKEIRDAKGADARVDPAVRDAGFAGLCKRASFRNSPTGRVRCPPPAGVAKAR